MSITTYIQFTVLQQYDKQPLTFVELDKISQH